MSDELLLEVGNASFGYHPKRPVIDAVSFKIHAGDFIVLRGANGCGKSTIVKGILGIARVTGGYVRWSIDRTSAGYVPQENSIPPEVPYTALDIVKCALDNLDRTANRVSVEALALVEMDNKANYRFGELSGGQKRRVLLARALVKKTRLLFLDEPTANVDNLTEIIIDKVLQNLIEKNNAAVVAVTHVKNFGKQARLLQVDRKL
jgi:ABC-type Mn2+/Zn2+ transport system ATPase subunit